MNAADETLDLLLDLKHDLGKYLLLPIALLPRAASDAALRDALRRALHETRKRGTQTRSARALWTDFEAALAAGTGLDQPGFARVRAAVERALGWELALAEQAVLEREAIERDFQAVQAAIAALVQEVQRG